MVCKNCGTEFEGNFCPVCGNPAEPVQEEQNNIIEPAAPVENEVAAFEAPINQSASDFSGEAAQAEYAPVQNNEFIAVLKSVFGSGTFLACAILISVGNVFSMMASSFNVFAILINIGAWIAYGAARSKKPGLSRSGFRMISGTFTAERIVLWICIGLLVACLIGVGIFSGIFLNETSKSGTFNDLDEAAEDLDELLDDAELNELLEEYGMDIYLDEMDIDTDDIEDFLDSFAGDIDSEAFSIAVVVVILFLLVMILAALIVMAVVYYGKLCKFCRSVVNSIDTGVNSIVKLNAVRVWFMVLGIFTAMGIPTAALALSAGAATATIGFAAAYILAFVVLGQLRDALAE